MHRFPPSFFDDSRKFVCASEKEKHSWRRNHAIREFYIDSRKTRTLRSSLQLASTTVDGLSAARSTDDDGGRNARRVTASRWATLPAKDESAQRSVSCENH